MSGQSDGSCLDAGRARSRTCVHRHCQHDGPLCGEAELLCEGVQHDEGVRCNVHWKGEARRWQGLLWRTRPRRLCSFATLVCHVYVCVCVSTVHARSGLRVARGGVTRARCKARGKT